MNLRNHHTIIWLIILFCLSVSCKQNNTKNNVLSVTIEPQAYFLETIVGKNFIVNCILPSGSNPESADFSPSQMLALGKSIAYFKIGNLGIENILINKIKENNPELKIIECSEGIQLLEHECGDEEHEHNHGHTGGDPHTWSSVKTAKVIAKNMYDGVVNLDQKNKEEYSKNYQSLLKEFDQTDDTIKHYIEKAPSKSFIIYHPALSYFAEEYGLEQIPIEYEGKAPSPLQIKALIDKAKTENIKVVFVQQEFDTKNAESIAKAIDGVIVPINLMSYNWKAEMIKIAKAIAGEYE